MSKRFAVIGLGLFGHEVAMSLAREGADVIAVDQDEDIIVRIKDHVQVAVQLDSTDREALATQDVHHVDAAIVGIGSEAFEECLLTVVNLKELGVKKVIGRAGTPLRKTILEKVGCDLVVLPEEDMGHRIAMTLISGLFSDRVEVGDHYSIVQLPAPAAFVGKTIVALNLREQYHINIVTIKTRVTERSIWGKETTREVIKAVPNPDDLIAGGDILVLFGHDDALDVLAQTLEK